MTEERRLVTVLFADVVGSTAMGESIDPEDLRALLGRYYSIARDAVEGHGGTVEKFIGDAVMAVFGLPVAHDDDADRALATALELRDRVRSDAALGERLPIRLGVQTGEVIAARDLSAADTLVTGDAVNTAARLQQAAEPWAVLVGERTVHASRSFAFGPATGMEARGKTAPVPCRVLVGPANERRRRVPIVGREGDLAQLELIASRAFREGRPFLVSVLAPAGVGKSRLLEEFVDRLPDVADDAIVALAQCLPYGQRLTYWPMRAIAHSILGLTDDAPPETVRAAAAARLSAAGDESAERRADLIAATVGGTEVEGIDRTALTDAWRALVETAAAEHPLVLAIEDLHWSSDSLLDLIEGVLQPRGEARLLMVVLARPELLDRRPTWGGGRRNYVSLALEPLDDAEVATLVEHLLDGPAPEIVGQIVERAEGNPFYAGEIVRAIIERTPDLRDERAVAAAVGALPDSVQATVLARIDGLPPSARRALQLGSVYGRSFAVPGIAVLEPRAADADGEAALQGAVEELVDRDLVRPTGTTVTFRHILIREVAYSTLPRAERARLHASAGEWLAARAVGREEELAELVAFHYREAATLAQLAGSLTPELRATTVRWLRLAADAAMAGAANYEAAGHLRSALELAEPDERMGLYEQIGDVLIGGDDSIVAYEQAETLADASNASATDRLRLIAAHLTVVTRWLGSVARTTPQGTAALRDAGLALLPRVSDRRVRGRFLAAIAFVPWALPELGEASIPASVAANEALEIGRELDDPNLQSTALDALGAIAGADNRLEDQVESGRERLRIGDRLDTMERGDAAHGVGWGLVQLGRLDEAVEVLSALHDRFGPGQGSWLRLAAFAWLANALRVLGRWDEALAASRGMLAAWIELDRGAAGYAAHGFLAGLETARGRRDQSAVTELTSASRELIAHFDVSRRIARLAAFVDEDVDAVRTRVVEGWGEFTGRLDYVEQALAFVSDRGGRVDPALLRDFVEYTAERNLRLIESQARRALGVATRDPDELHRAIDLFGQMGARPYLGRARAELGLLTGDLASFEAGTAELERIGDVVQLDRLAAARSTAFA